MSIEQIQRDLSTLREMKKKLDHQLKIEELEKRFTISISYNGNYYMIFNFFGKLWFTAPTLEDIEREMNNIYALR